MKLQPPLRRQRRQGAALVLIALLCIPLLGMVAFAVDYGFLLKVRGDLQRTADAAALAAVRDLLPLADGSQDEYAVRAVVRGYVAKNLGETFNVADADIKIGRYDPATIYTKVSLKNDGIHDAVRITLRRDSQVNSAVSLFFAPILGARTSSVTATSTAALGKPRDLLPGADVLPFAVPLEEWDELQLGQTWIIYGDGKLENDQGDSVPGNWGTVDIGSSNNSTSDLGDQVVHGLDQTHLDALYADGRISSSTHIDATQPLWVNADPGLSSGMKSSVTAIHGQTRLIPLYGETNSSGGNGLEFKIEKWGAVTVVDSAWKGAKGTYVKVRKSIIYDVRHLGPDPDLSNPAHAVPGAFTSAVLVE